MELRKTAVTMVKCKRGCRDGNWDQKMFARIGKDYGDGVEL